jgi:lysophospholipase L1-like esterase
VPDVNGKRVLVFGDSLSYGASSPGYAMGEALAKNGATVEFNARIGRSAWNFFAREQWESQLAEGKDFDVVIVELGTNDIGMDPTLERAQMIRIRDAFAQHAEVWAFGPPAFPKTGMGSREHQGSPPVVSMMSEVFGGKFIDLRPLSSDMVPAGANGRASDGVHFTGAGAKTLGDRMAKTFLSASDSGSLPIVIALGLAALAYLFAR